MSEQESIKKALSVLRASENTLEEVMNMANQKKADRKTGWIKRPVSIAAALIALCVTTAFAADYALNHREIFFFDTLEELAVKQNADDPSTAGSYTVPGSAEENQDLETVAEGVARKLEFGYYGEETVLSDEADADPETMWTRKRITECLHDDYGPIINEYRTGEAYAGDLEIEGLLDWDISSLQEGMTPDPGGQLVLVSRDAGDGALVMANALLGYATADGKRFQIEYKYDRDSRYLQEQEYILSSEYDSCYIYTTDDQVEVLIQEYDGQIWADAVNAEAGNAVYFYTTGCTAAEMEALLDGLDLAVPMYAGT